MYSARDLWDEILEQSRAITTDKFRYIKNYKTDLSLDAKQAYLEFYRPAVHIMRGLYENEKLNELQSKFFSPTKESEELYDLENDPFETNNLISDPAYTPVVNEMKGHFKDWNSKNKDLGFEPIDWENAPPPRATAIIEWLKREHPEIIELMESGIEPGFGRIIKEYNKATKE